MTSDPFELLKTYLRVECVIVPSERDPGLVSIRFAGGGKAGTLKRALTDAGFKAGDAVMIVPLKKGRSVRRAR